MFMPMMGPMSLCVLRNGQVRKVKQLVLPAGFFECIAGFHLFNHPIQIGERPHRGTLFLSYTCVSSEYWRVQRCLDLPVPTTNHFDFTQPSASVIPNSYEGSNFSIFDNFSGLGCRHTLKLCFVKESMKNEFILSSSAAG